jgi:serine/threonine protein kinase
VTDFGIAKLHGGTLHTVPGVRLGTPAYMSPEQAQGAPVDERSDLYSLATVLFELLTGRPPFDGDDPFAVALQHITQPAPDPRFFRAGIPLELAAIVTKGMSKDPARRFQSASEMAAALAPFAERGRRRVPEPRGGAGTCPGCGSAVRSEFEACPACGARLSTPCGVCRQSYRTFHEACPFCWTLAPGAPPQAAPPSVAPEVPTPRSPWRGGARMLGDVVKAALKGLKPHPAPARSCACGSELQAGFLRCPICGRGAA